MLLLKELPYVFAVAPNFFDELCWTCLSYLKAKHRCSRCKLAHYCSVPCQRQGWPDHKSECRPLQKHNYVPVSYVRLLLRMWSKRDKPIDESTRPLNQLMTHLHELMNDCNSSKLFATTYAELKNFVGDSCDIPEEWAMRMFGVLQINSLQIMDPSETELGTGLYLNLSIIDHTCKPTAVIEFDGPLAFLNKLTTDNDPKTLKEAKANWQNETISYVSYSLPSKERQKILREYYFFDCVCSRCKDQREDKLMFAVQCDKCGGDAISEELNRHEHKCVVCSHVFNLNADEVKGKAAYILKNVAKIDDADMLPLCDEVLSDASSVLAKRNLFRLQVAQQAMNVCIKACDAARALKYAEENGIIEIVGALENPGNHIVGDLGRLCLKAKMYDKAVFYLTKALTLTEVWFSSEHPHCVRVKQSLTVAQRLAAANKEKLPT